MTIPRCKTRQIRVGSLFLGGNAPIRVQSMTNTPTHDIAATSHQIKRLQAAGCEIVRVAVPDQRAAEAISGIKDAIDIPLIADIHFDHRLAIAAAEAGSDGLRINPGNIGSRRNVKAVVDCATRHQIPIRIGVNAGSLEKPLLEKYGSATAQAMVESAQAHVRLLTDLGFDQIKISLKASDVPRTVAAYRLLSQTSDWPLHLGITEAGTLFSGIVKSAMGIGMLLAEGIGDTLRVSLTRDPVDEIRVAWEILKGLGLRKRGPDIIACPTCGRCGIDLFKIVEKVEKTLLSKTVPIKIAIMGCVVNGPGEAREADIGIAGGKEIGILFRKGEVVAKFPQDQLADRLLAEVETFEQAWRKSKETKKPKS